MTTETHAADLRRSEANGVDVPSCYPSVRYAKGLHVTYYDPTNGNRLGQVTPAAGMFRVELAEWLARVSQTGARLGTAMTRDEAERMLACFVDVDYMQTRDEFIADIAERANRALTS